MNKFELPEVVAIPNLGYGVRSASVPGALRVVHGNDCTCPAAEHGARQCRHRRAVAIYCAEQAEKYKRPVAPPHVAALCD